MIKRALQFLVLSTICTIAVLYHAISSNTDPEFALDQQHHRSLQGLGGFLGFTRFVGPGLCWLGIDLSSFFDVGDALGGALPIDPSALLGGCLCKDYQIEEELAAAVPGTTRAIELCAGTIRVQKPFDVTNKRITFSCTTPAIFACGFSALDSTSIFTGTPELLTFQQTKFTRAINAISLTGGRLTLTNVGFVNNAGTLGSAISMKDGTVTVREGTFRRNEATGTAPYGAGAIYVDNSTLTIQQGGGFFENEAEGNGGAILAVNSEVTIQDATFEDNSAGGFGDAIALFTSDLDLTGTVFAGRSKNRNSKNKDKHLRFLGNNKNSRDSKDRDDDEGDDDEVIIEDDYVRNHQERFGFPSEFQGMGNLIFIGDDIDPVNGTLVDCDTTTPPIFCSGVDILEVGTMINNTNNCREIDSSGATECKNH